MLSKEALHVPSECDTLLRPRVPEEPINRKRQGRYSSTTAS